MQPTRTTRHRNSPQPDTLYVADIPGTRSGHSDWLRPRAQPLNPLEPAYQWLPIREDHAPVPKFVRDTLDVSDIVGRKAAPAALCTARSHNNSLPSTMTADDIEGTRPGWKAHKLFAEPRDTLKTSDISAAPPTHKEKQAQQLQRQLSNAAGASGTAGLGSTACETSAPFGRTHRLPSGLPLAGCSSVPGQSNYSTTSGAAGQGCYGTPSGTQQAGQQQQQQQLPDCGMAFNADWHKQRLGAKMAEAGAARQARAAADEAIATAAAAVAARTPAGALGDGGSSSSSCGGLAGVLKNLKTCDRDHTGRVQASELAAALQRSGLQLSQGEVSQLVTSVRDSHGSVEWRPFVSKMWSQLQQHTATAAPRDSCAAGGGAGGASHSGQGSMPQFVAVRQRRLQTHVALALNQQPEALAAEAAEVGNWATSLPWQLPSTTPSSKRVFERHEEFPEALSFSQGDEQAAAQASLQWRASKSAQLAWCMRRENRPSKQTRAHGANAGPTSLPPTPAHRMGQQAQAPMQWPAHAGGSAPPVNFTIMHRKAGSPLLAAERAAREAGSAEVALVRSLE